MIVGSSVGTRVMLHRNLSHFCTTCRQHWAKEPVPAFKSRQLVHQRGFQESGGTTGVTNLLPEDPISDPVGNLADPSGAVVILTLFTPAQNGIRIRLARFSPESGDVGRVILSIGIERGHPLPTGMFCSDGKCCGLTTLPMIFNQFQTWFRYGKMGNNLARGIC